MLSLRDYQQEALQSILKEYQAGITRQLVALPTGTGKTILFAALAREMNRPTLIIAHREELLQQARDKMLMLWPEADIGLIKAERNEIDHQILIASIQTISRPRRLQELKERGLSLLIIDEAHHSAAGTYQRVIKELGFMGTDPGRLFVGVTATPSRGDKIGLDSVFQKVVYQRSLPTMIRAGYLSDLKAIRVKAETDLKGIHTRAGDFAPGELEAAINTTERNRIIVASFKQYAEGRRAAAFCAGVQHAQDLAECFNQADIKAAAVWGAMDPQERRSTLHAYEQGEIQVLTNCEILTEGWDSPATNCLLMARPTKSSPLYMQMIGRGTRTYPGKEDCLIIEFTANRHDIATLGGLTGLPIRNKQTVLQAMQEEQEKREQTTKTEAKATRVIAKEFDILDRSSFRWHQAGKDWRLPIAPKRYIQLREEEPGKYAVALAADGIGFLNLADGVLPFGYAQGVAEDYARQNAQGFARKDAKWAAKPATLKQAKLLTKLRIKFDPGINRVEAAKLIDEELARRNTEPATRRQVAFIKQLGVRVPEGLTKQGARHLIASSV